MPADDGAELLTGPQVGGLLEAAVRHAGGLLQEWELDHVDAQPRSSTTATYAARVAWPSGERHELLGVSARVQGPSEADVRAEIFADGDREGAVWLYPNDPELPGLPRAAYAASMAAILTDYRVVEGPLAPTDLTLEMMTYRPRRRAVLRDTVVDGATFYTKVLRESTIDPVARRHRLLLDAGVPAPPVLARTPDHLLVLGVLRGDSLARALFQPGRSCTAEQLIGILDAMPSAVAGLERRPPWADAAPRSCGPLEMVKRSPAVGHRPRRTPQAQARFGLDLADAAERPSQIDTQLGHTFALCGGGGEQQLVVVAPCQDAVKLFGA